VCSRFVHTLARELVRTIALQGIGQCQLLLTCQYVVTDMWIRMPWVPADAMT